MNVTEWSQSTVDYGRNSWIPLLKERGLVVTI